MPRNRPKLTQPSDDLSHGQWVIITARWILVLAGLLLILSNPGPIGALRFQIITLLLLAVANFYLCAQVLRRQPALEVVVYSASLADLLVITAIILSQSGFDSNPYVFYLPALLAISVAFPTAMLFLFTGGAIAAYTFIGLMTSALTDGDLQILVIRLLMLAAIAVCGNQYWRIENGRRRSLTEAQPGPTTRAPELEAAAPTQA